MRPAVRLEPPPSPDELEDLERAKRGAAAIAYLAERGVTEAGRRRAALSRFVDELAAAAASAEDVETAILRVKLQLVRRLPFSIGGVVICDECHQVGEALEIVAHRVRWFWPGRDRLGNLVYPTAVRQAREVGDTPPCLCPDHEDQAIRAGILERVPVLELERRVIR
jgi:hypothetical protein